MNRAMLSIPTSLRSRETDVNIEIQTGEEMRLLREESRMGEVFSLSELPRGLRSSMREALEDGLDAGKFDF